MTRRLQRAFALLYGFPASRGSLSEHLVQEVAVPGNGERAVGVRLGVLAREPPHLRQVVPAVVARPNRLREPERVAWWDDDPALGLADELRRLTLILGGREHGPAGGEYTVETARHDVPREA